MINHPSIQGRQLVLVGDYNEARTWADHHDINLDLAIIAGAARQIVALDPPCVHLIVLPSARNWRNPYFFMLRTELSFMHAKGATLEWA